MKHIYEKITAIYERVNPIEGGIGDDLEPSDVDRNELKMGINVEFEHCNKAQKVSDEELEAYLNGEAPNELFDIAQDIALDHLKEIPDYYTRLDKMEQDAKNKKVSDNEGRNNWNYWEKT